jgi:hypothetical protein
VTSKFIHLRRPNPTDRLLNIKIQHISFFAVNDMLTFLGSHFKLLNLQSYYGENKAAKFNRNYYGKRMY